MNSLEKTAELGEVTEMALRLTPHDQSLLLSRLFDNLESMGVDTEHEAGRAAEIERRVQEIDRGKAKLVDHEIVAGRLQKRFGSLFGSLLILVISIVVLATSVCSSTSGLEKNGPAQTAHNDPEIEYVRARFKEHESRLSGMMWSVTHNYSNKSEMDEIIKYLSTFMRGLSGSDELNKLGSLQQAKDKFAAYTTSKDSAVRGFAAMILGIIGDKNYAPVVGRILDAKPNFEREPDEMTDGSKGQAAISLSLMGATEYEEKILDLLKSGSDFNRSGAMTALISLGGKKHAKAVVAVMLDEKAYAADKLAPLHFLLETGAALDYKKELIGLMQKSFDSEQRKAIIFLFVKLNATDTKAEIARLLNTDFVKGDAAKALALMKATEYEDMIAGLLTDDKALVRKDAALALGLLGSVKKAEKVSKLLSDENDFVRQYAAISLVLMDSKPHLATAVQIVDGFKKNGAYLNLGEFHPFIEEKAQEVIREFDDRLSAARAKIQSDS